MDNYRRRCAILISSLFFLNLNCKNTFSGEKINFSRRTPTWSERNPVTAKLLNWGGYIGLGVGGILGTSYVINSVLDKIYPERVKERNKTEELEKKIKEINDFLINNVLSKNDNGKSDELSKLKEEREIIKSILEEKNKSKNSKILEILAMGHIIAFGSQIMNLVSGLGKFAKSLGMISWLRWSFENFKEMYNSAVGFLKPPPREMQKEDALSMFDELFNEYYGQKSVKSVLKSHIFDILVAKDQAKWKNEKYSKCDIIYLHGPSGVGKSFIAKRLPKVLLSSGEPLVISSSDINNEKKESIVDQLFNSGDNYSDSDRLSPSKQLPNYLKNNSGGVIIFEEYDKVCTPALDEILRGLCDRGTVNIDGKTVEWYGTIIITSNEDDISMDGFDPKNVADLDEKGIQEGYTRVKHSKSFLNRIKRVKFENLTVDDYEKVIEDHFSSISSYWSAPENDGIGLIIDKDSSRRIATEVQKRNQGARPVDLWAIPEIQMVIGEKIKSLNENSSENSNNKIFTISYENGKFSIC